MPLTRNIATPTFTPLARAWLVRVKQTEEYPAFGSRVGGSVTAITGAKHTEIPNAYTEEASVPVFERIRCFDLYGYTRSLNWEWKRIGGCGKFSCIFTLDKFGDYWRINDLVDGSRGASKGYDVNSIIMKDDDARDITFRRMIQERWELEVEVSFDTVTPTWFTVYRGTILKGRVSSGVSGGQVYVLSGYGLIEELRRLMVNKDYDYRAGGPGSGLSTSQIVSDIIVNHVITRGRVLWNPDKIDLDDLTHEVLRFHTEGSAIRALQSLSFFEGKVEWGVDQDGEFYFLRESIEPNIDEAIGVQLRPQQASAVEWDLDNTQAPTHVHVAGREAGSIVNVAEVFDAVRTRGIVSVDERIVNVPEVGIEEDLERVGNNYINSGHQEVAGLAVGNNFSLQVIDHVVKTSMELTLPMLKAVFFDDLTGEYLIAPIDSIVYRVGGLEDAVLQTADGQDFQSPQSIGLTATYCLGKGRMTIAEEFEKRDQSIQALLQRGLQKRYPGEGLHLPSVGEVSGDLFVKENIDEPNDDGLYVYLSSSVPQLNGWVRLQSASEQLPLTVVYDPRNDGEGAGGSTNPLISYKENGTSYFEMPTDAVKIIPFNGAISSFGKKDDLAIAIRFRASFSDSMTSDDQAVLVVRWATAIADDIASSLIFNERMFLLRDDGGFTAGVTSVFFKAIILGRDFEDDSSLFLQFGRLGDDPRDNYSGSVELQMPQFKFMVMRPNDIVNNCFVGSARVSEGDPQTVYDTDYAGLLGLPSRRL